MLPSAVEPTWSDLGPLLDRARKAGVSFALTYSETNDSWSFETMSAARSECDRTRSYSWPTMIEAAGEILTRIERGPDPQPPGAKAGG